MIPTFQSQIERGGPVTVIHFDMTSYFTTTAEACELVVQAGATSDTRQMIMLDTGVPVRISTSPAA